MLHLPLLFVTLLCVFLADLREQSELFQNKSPDDQNGNKATKTTEWSFNRTNLFPRPRHKLGYLQVQLDKCTKIYVGMQSRKSILIVSLPFSISSTGSRWDCGKIPESAEGLQEGIPWLLLVRKWELIATQVNSKLIICVIWLNSGHVHLKNKALHYRIQPRKNNNNKKKHYVQCFIV